MKNGRQSIKTSGYCHKHFYQSQNCTQPPNVSLRPEVSILITKFTCQLGSKSTRVGECALSGLDFFI